MAEKCCRSEERFLFGELVLELLVINMKAFVVSEHLPYQSATGPFQPSHKCHRANASGSERGSTRRSVT